MMQFRPSRFRFVFHELCFSCFVPLTSINMRDRASFGISCDPGSQKEIICDHNRPNQLKSTSWNSEDRVFVIRNVRITPSGKLERWRRTGERWKVRRANLWKVSLDKPRLPVERDRTSLPIARTSEEIP